MKKLYFVILLLVIGLAGNSFGAEKSMKAVLSGGEEVPPVTTSAKGEATFKLSKNSERLSYKLSVSDIENVTAAHIHSGKVGENGPPLAPIQIKSKKGKFSGTLGKGTITAKELTGSLKGKTVKDLVAEIEAGNAYINVHTGKYPDGEIRGQIK